MSGDTARTSGQLAHSTSASLTLCLASRIFDTDSVVLSSFSCPFSPNPKDRPTAEQPALLPSDRHHGQDVQEPRRAGAPGRQGGEDRQEGRRHEAAGRHEAGSQEQLHLLDHQEDDDHIRRKFDVRTRIYTHAHPRTHTYTRGPSSRVTPSRGRGGLGGCGDAKPGADETTANRALPPPTPRPRRCWTR